MRRQVPIVREVRWLWLVPQLCVLGILVWIARSIVGANEALLAGAGFYFLYLVGARSLVAHEHRRGIRLVRQQQWSEATPHFRRSYEFFSRHPWIDRFRWLALLSLSAASYREMALLNEAFALAQQGLRREARSVYARVLREFPESSMARTALNLMEPERSG